MPQAICTYRHYREVQARGALRLSTRGIIRVPDFQFRASTARGSLETGSLSASSRQAALRRLRAQGLTPLHLEPLRSGAIAGGVTAAVPRASSDGGAAFQPDRTWLATLTSDLATLLRAGLPIDRALRVKAEGCSDARESDFLLAILEGVKSGKALSRSLEEYPQIFGSFYLNMVRAGEVSGHLAAVLERLAATLHAEVERRSAIVSALIYPAILLVVAVIAVGVMLGFVVPQFEALFSDMGEALPLMTRAVIALGDWVQSYFLVIVMLLTVVTVWMSRWLRTDAGRLWRDQHLLSMPLFGQIVHKYAVAQFSRTLGTLLSNGVRMLTAITIASDTVENRSVHEQLRGLPSRVKGGTSISDIMAEMTVFPPLVIQMVRVGEESGRLGDMLLELARVYDGEVDQAVRRVLSLLEPALILVMGLIIAVLIVSILMGILSVNDLAL